MFTCTCCSPARSYTKRKNLYRHQRLHDQDNYVDPRAREAQERRDDYYASPHKCLTCEEVLAYEDIVAGRKDKFCSRSCSAKHNNQPGIARRPRVHGSSNCTHCDASLVGRAARKYCSQTCQSEHEYETFIAEWKLGNVSGGSDYKVSNYVRRYLFEKHNGACVECGWDKINPTSGKKPLTVDHIDGDPSNHKEENLRLLCPSCHSLTPTYCALNTGSGRAYRRQRYAEGKSY